MGTEIASVPPDRHRVHSRTLSKIRHDLKTPLNQIIGYAEMLLEDAGAAGRTEAESCAAPAARFGAGLPGSPAAAADTPSPKSCDGALSGAQEDQTARSVYMQEILAELRAEPASTEWAQDLDRLGIAVSNLGALAREAAVPMVARRGIRSRPRAGRSSRTDGVVPRRESAGDSEPETRANSRPGGRILVVDDNAANRDMLSRRLEREGYSVDTASQRAARRWRSWKPAAFDLVLLDMVMPELDGFAVLQSIRAEPALEGSGGDYDLRARRDPQRGALHRDGRRGLFAEAL